MKKLVLALMATAAVVFGFGGVANAGTYPPGDTQIVYTTTTPTGGSTFTVTVPCLVGETVTLSIPEIGFTQTATCVAASDGGSLVKAEQTTGTATFEVTAPETPGEYTVTATGSTSGDLGSFSFTVAAQTDTTVAPEVTVPAGGLPATGSSGIGTSAGIAIGLLVVGVGLFAVATVRRRDASIA